MIRSESLGIAGLTPEGEQQWLRLLNHVQWSEAFSLILIFSQNAKIVALFRQRLEQVYRLRVSRLSTIRFEVAEQLLTVALPELLGANHSHKIIGAPVWLDLTYTNSDDHGPATRSKFYQRLNENRETLREQQRAVIIVLPVTEKQSFRELAPDLWTIRDLTIETGNWLEIENYGGSNEMRTGAGSTESLPAIPLNAAEHQYIDEWQRVKHQQDRGVLFAAQRAFDISLSHGQYMLAGEIAADMHSLAKRLKDSGETPQGLRDLSVSLDNMGNVARERGEFEAAQEHYAESRSVSDLLNKFNLGSEKIV